MLTDEGPGTDFSRSFHDQKWTGWHAALRLVTIVRLGGDVLMKEDESSVWFSYT
jgi:hypothetical protein